MLLLELNGLEINSGEHKSSQRSQNENSEEIKKEFEEISTEETNIEVCVEEALDENREENQQNRANDGGPMEIEWLEGMPDDPYPDLNDTSPKSNQGWL